MSTSARRSAHAAQRYATRPWPVALGCSEIPKAYEYPTFEWFASLVAADIDARLWWSDFPDELSLEARTVAGNALILRVRSALRERRPALGALKSMDVPTWRAWMVSLGSPFYS